MSNNEGSNDLQLLEELAQVAQAPLQLPLLLLHHPGDRPPGLVLLQELQQVHTPSDSAAIVTDGHTIGLCRLGSRRTSHQILQEINRYVLHNFSLDNTKHSHASEP